MENKSNFRYQVVFDELRTAIQAQKILPGSFLPSESELCLHYGIKRGTARKALDLLVSDGLIEKVPGKGSLVSDPNIQHSAPVISPDSFSQRRTIALITSDASGKPRTLSQPFYADLFYNLELECKSRGCQLVYASNTHGDALRNFLSVQKLATIVFVSHTDPDSIRIAGEYNFPILLINDEHKGITSVSYDGVKGAYSVVEHLIKNGHRNIAFITGSKSFYTSSDRLIGCYGAINTYGLTIPKSNFVPGNWEYQSGYDGAVSIFRDCPPLERPTAIFAFNDMMGIGAINALQHMGYAVPDDISIVGFDNMDELKFTHTNLTTVDTNIAEIARVVIRLATHPELIADLPGLRIKVDTNLVIQDTVKKISAV